MKKLIILALVAVFACSSTAKNDRQSEKKYVFQMSKISVSQEKLGNGKTFQLYMRLLENTNEINIKIIAVSTLSSERTRNLSTYFVLDKSLSKLKYEKNTDIYTEIYRNFDNNWNILPESTISEQKDDPLGKLTAGNYRIKFLATDSNTEEIVIITNEELKADFSTEPSGSM